MDIVLQRNEAAIVDAYWKMLRTLGIRVKLKLATMLTSSALEEETIADARPARRKCRVIRRTGNTPSDAQLEERFMGLEMPPVPKEEPAWSEVINANIGKTIKPIEKWL